MINFMETVLIRMQIEGCMLEVGLTVQRMVMACSDSQMGLGTR